MRRAFSAAACVALVFATASACGDNTDPDDFDEFTGDCATQCRQAYDACTIECDDEVAEDCQVECDLELPVCTAGCEEPSEDLGQPTLTPI